MHTDTNTTNAMQRSRSTPGSLIEDNKLLARTRCIGEIFARRVGNRRPAEHSTELIVTNVASSVWQRS